MLAKIRAFFSARRLSNGAVLGVMLIVLLGAFVLGTRQNEIISYLRGFYQNGDIARNLDYSSLEEVYDRLRENYDGKLDPNKLLEGAKKGLVAAAGDPYTAFFTDEEYQETLDDLEGKFSGIGAELSDEEGRVVVRAVLDDSPAKKAGLMPRDVIVKVNDQSTEGWGIDKAVSEIRGEKDTTVKLTVLRDQEIKEYSIVRADIVTPSVKYEIKDNVGYIRISRFANGDTASLARQAAQEFKSKGVKGVILDLRGNGGGYVDSAESIANIWLNNKLIVEEKSGGKTNKKIFSGSEPILGGMPTVVLVDSGSASASEIVAGALKDHGAAQLVGMSTFGKGTVQQFFELMGASGHIKVTVAHWFTPNGVSISDGGLEPDHKVDISKGDMKAGRDPQKDKAYELLK